MFKLNTTLADWDLFFFNQLPQDRRKNIPVAETLFFYIELLQSLCKWITITLKWYKFRN